MEWKALSQKLTSHNLVSEITVSNFPNRGKLTFKTPVDMTKIDLSLQHMIVSKETTVKAERRKSRLVIKVRTLDLSSSTFKAKKAWDSHVSPLE